MRVHSPGEKLAFGMTVFHAQYFAYALTKLCSPDDIERLASALSDAQVDLNPHQVDAALFAFRSPFSKGAILADEVGLGKTIEAGLLLSQKWAERKRKLLIIVPSNLRKQWSQELADKFFLPSFILEKRSFDQEINDGRLNPFDQSRVVICSYQFAKTKHSYVCQTNWNLVVIDEAHRLRNVYKPGSKIASTIKNSTEKFKKVLLTATPLQNSLQELYGLVTLIDDHIFGDLKSFQTQFSHLTNESNYNDLKERIKPVCKRSLRRQVLEYIKYTNRHAIVQEFCPSVEEEELYENLSEYLQRPNLYALPSSQRSLMTLILRKLMASSTFAIADTLYTLKKKLENILVQSNQAEKGFEERIANNFEEFDELVDEWEEDEDSELSTQKHRSFTQKQLNEIEEEKESLDRFYALAKSIEKNSKGEVLLVALRKGLKQAEDAQKQGGGEQRLQKKAIIFTESKRTQEYLFQKLQQTEFSNKLILFNGTNNDDLSKAVYQNWLEKHRGTDLISGSVTVDKRTALVEYFRDHAEIMIATEAAAEGINLQFCNMVVNYDLPWNPQRIEQRIGRCHRYGQKYDVIVVNFLNKSNAADLRVYELLSEKFKLFEGVFGASDEVLGVVESGLDFEKQIAKIVQNCRTEEQIQGEFDILQQSMEETIRLTQGQAREDLLNNFDQEVIEKVKIDSEKFLSKFEERLWRFTQFSLGDYAEFDEDNRTFVFTKNPFQDEFINDGPYRMVKMAKRDENVNNYRIGHPLAQKLLDEVKQQNLLPAHVIFDLTNSGKKTSILEPLTGRIGWVQCSLQLVHGLELEEYLLLVGVLDNSQVLDAEQCSRLFDLPGSLKEEITVFDNDVQKLLSHRTAEVSNNLIDSLQVKNSTWFDKEFEKIEKWGDDKKISLKLSIEKLDQEIRNTGKQIRQSGHLADKVRLQRIKRELSKDRDKMEEAYREAKRKIDHEMERVLTHSEKQLTQNVEIKPIFTLHFSIL